jgi:hypothetical protein
MLLKRKELTGFFTGEYIIYNHYILYFWIGNRKVCTLTKISYSSLPDTTAESGGKYPEVVHFAGKNHAEQYIRKLGIPNVTFIYLGFYSQNIGVFVPKIEKENGEIELAFPYLEENDKLPIIDAENDTGVRNNLINILFFLFYVNKQIDKSLKKKTFFIANCRKSYWGRTR